MKHKSECVSVLASAALLAAPLAATAQSGGNEDSYLKPIENRAAEKWWLESWRQGWEYRADSRFEFSARTKVRNADKVNAADTFWGALRKEMLEAPRNALAKQAGEVELQISGASAADSTVLRKDQEVLLIARSYPRVDMRREILRKAVEGSGFDIIEAVVQPNRVRRAIRAIFGWFVKPLAATSGAPSVAGAEIANQIGNYIGDYADEQFDNAFKREGFSYNKDKGAIEVDPDSKSARELLGDRVSGIMGIAAKLSTEYRNRLFFIRASEKKGNMLDARDIRDPGIVRTFVARNEKEPDAAREALYADVEKSPQVSAIVRGSLQRESFILTREIFDYQERKPGDKWILDAKVFNSLLHPDLQGSFNGKAIVMYEMDTTAFTQSGATYPARKLKLVFRDEVGGRMVVSDFEYSEQGGDEFSARFNPTTTAVFLIDKERNYLRQATIALDNDHSSKLPHLYLAEGFEGVGRSIMSVHYRCDGAPVE